MNKKIALLVYPEFSLQEVANLMYLFRWHFDTCTDIIYPEIMPIKSEEGINVLPDKMCRDFCAKAYDCLILSGCSNFRSAIRNTKIKQFLHSLKDNETFVIGAICAGPLFLAQAGLLKGKKYTDSLYVEMRELFNFIEEENFVPAPVVEDNNIVTAVGSAFNEFAVKIARKVGYNCPDKILSGYLENVDDNYFFPHLSETDLQAFKMEFKEWL